MPRIPYRFPAPGTSPIADAIRQRRGERGLTPLDGMLLNAPSVAQGWNTLLGAVRTGSSLPDQLREIMILRVAARNRAAFEWIHHEHLATKAGITEQQLTRIGDLSLSDLAAFSRPGAGELTPPQAAAVCYADAMTANVKVPDAVFSALRAQLQKAAGDSGATEATTAADQMFVEATATVAAYNMVSRFLVALDVDDRANDPVPVPGLPPVDSSTPTFPLPSSSSTSSSSRGLVQVSGGQTLSTRVHFHSMQAPWVLLINSLMTDLTMWDGVLPGLSTAGYNVACYDQRGHGGSPAPAQPCTVEQLADDAADVLSALGVECAHAVVGVSQGGATALAFALRHPTRATKIIANDTQAVSPAANFQAWEDRIALAHSRGMQPLADATVERWYAAPGVGSPGVKAFAHALIASTDVKGFEQGARALQKYDLVAQGLLQHLAHQKGGVLLVAGEADGALPKVLADLREQVVAAAEQDAEAVKSRVTFQSVPAAAHLPMLDNPQGWLDVVLPFLKRAA